MSQRAGEVASGLAKTRCFVGTELLINCHLLFVTQSVNSKPISVTVAILYLGFIIYFVTTVILCLPHTWSPVCIHKFIYPG